MTLARQANPEEARHLIRLGGRAVPYVLRRTERARGLRIVVDPRQGLVVTVPPSRRRGWAHPEDRVVTFLRDREAWILRHLGRLERDRASQVAAGGARDGGALLYRGEVHRIRVVVGTAGLRRSRVERTGADDGDELTVWLGSSERRSVPRILEAWLRERAVEAVERAIAVHASALRVRPAEVVLRDPRTRWGSASRKGRIMVSWRLVLAPPGALETVVVHELAHLRVFGHGPAFWDLVAARRPDHLKERAWLRRHSFALHAALEVPEAA
jgi:predicted metal-dependent hydrolase